MNMLRILAVSLLLAVSAQAGGMLSGADPLPPPILLSVLDGVVSTGAEITVSTELSGDTANRSSSAGVDIQFDPSALAFDGTVVEGCEVAERLADTHSVGGRMLRPGVLNVELYVRGTPATIPPLGDGLLFHCRFRALGKTGFTSVRATNVLVGGPLGGIVATGAEHGTIDVQPAASPATPTPGFASDADVVMMCTDLAKTDCSVRYLFRRKWNVPD
jgi:hypothetical protein